MGEMYESASSPDQSPRGNMVRPDMPARHRVRRSAILLPPFDHLLIAYGAAARSAAGCNRVGVGVGVAAIDLQRGMYWIRVAYSLVVDTWLVAAWRFCRQGWHELVQALLHGGLWPRFTIASIVAAGVTLSSYLAQSAVSPPQPPAPAPAPPALVLTTAKVDRLDAYVRETQVTDALAQPASESGVFDWSSASRRIATHTVTGANGEKTFAIRITVPEGTPVRAAADGVVEFAGDATDGLGNKVVLRHGAIGTVYAHVSEILVKDRSRVRKGQVIAKSGQSGFATTPRLYLAIVSSDPGTDPIAFFSGTTTAGKAGAVERCTDARCDERKPAAAKNGVSFLTPRRPAPPAEISSARPVM
jgi:murein DD-endopeptidase MepM/ murein hydrolase activator NlpD